MDLVRLWLPGDSNYQRSNLKVVQSSKHAYLTYLFYWLNINFHTLLNLKVENLKTKFPVIVVQAIQLDMEWSKTSYEQSLYLEDVRSDLNVRSWLDFGQSLLVAWAFKNLKKNQKFSIFPKQYAYLKNCKR